ncbi:MAG: peptidylprolyl isomerase [Rubrivivax sp.]
MTESKTLRRAVALVAMLVAAVSAAVPAAAQLRERNGDYIVAIVNSELVTAGEIDRRLQRLQEDAARSGSRLPPEATLRQQVMDALIDERVIVTYARDSGVRIDEAELDRAVQSVAQQNQLNPDQLRERLRADGMDYTRFRANLRDQMLIERIREREVQGRIRVPDNDIEAYIEQQRSAVQGDAEINLAQILVTVPEGADAATLAARKARIDAALARVQAGEDFAKVAREISEDGNRERGGEIGSRPASRLPDLFIEGVQGLAAGQVSAAVLRSGAGFHLLKVIERQDDGALRVTQTRARHILLRTSAQLTAEVAARRLAEYKRQIESGSRSFEDLARQYSEDGSAAGGGELGWAMPGQFVPEFEEAMNRLAIGGISAPLVSRFGVHLIQVLERRQVAQDMKQVREQARNVLREQKFEGAYADWAKELRARAYVEMREPPQ